MPVLCPAPPRLWKSFQAHCENDFGARENRKKHDKGANSRGRWTRFRDECEKPSRGEHEQNSGLKVKDDSDGEPTYSPLASLQTA